MCLLHSHYGGVLGDRSCGAGCHRSPSIGSFPLVWCPGFQTSLNSVLQGHKRALHGRLDRGSRCGTVEFTQTNRSSGSLIGGSSTSKVKIYIGGPGVGCAGCLAAGVQFTMLSINVLIFVIYQPSVDEAMFSVIGCRICTEPRTKYKYSVKATSSKSRVHRRQDEIVPLLEYVKILVSQ